MKPARLTSYSSCGDVVKVEIVGVGTDFVFGVDSPHGDKVRIAIGSNQQLTEIPPADEYYKTPSVLADTAMCLWEWCIEDSTKGVDYYRQKYGTAELRSLCVAIAPVVDDLWKNTELLENRDTFDWDFVPQFMAECVIWYSF